MAQAEEGEVVSSSISSEDYAMIRAVLARINGLRLMMVATGIAGIFASAYDFLVTLAQQALQGNINAFFVASEYAILTYIPFIGIIGYLSMRVNKHVRRLSRGRFVPPPEEDE